MTRDQALSLIQEAEGEYDEPQFVPRAALKHLNCSDIPKNVMVSVGEMRDGVMHMDWDGHFYVAGKSLAAHCQYLWTRKYWNGPLGMPQYLDLIKRSIETRERLRRDVKLLEWDDTDGAYIHLIFEVYNLPDNLEQAYDYAQNQLAKFQEAAEEASDRAGVVVAEIAQRTSGWGTTSLEKLVEVVETSKTSDEKGRALEELVARMFGSIAGLTVSGRVKTETEEIDISILNGSDDHWLKREDAIILIECKNWSKKCGKNEFVIFKSKIENRKGRCSLGFLVSWNGFAETVSKEMLRGSSERVLIVPLTGKDIREAIRSGDPFNAIATAWTMAINT